MQVGAEEWLPVPGYERQYEVSSLGRVRSLRRGGRLLALGLDRDGYVTVHLSLAGRAAHEKVHRLVLSAFGGPAPPGLVCRHGDDDRSNNRVGNLCWGTVLENNQDRKERGKYPVGEENHLAKLTAEQVLEIRASSARTGQILRQYGISKGHLHRIRHRLVWAHV